MASELANRVRALDAGDHLCLLYHRDPAEQMPALVPFIADALRGREQFIYIADDQTVAELSHRLQAAGIDVAGCSGAGALKLWTREQWRQPGALNSQRKAAQVREFIDAARAEGYCGARFAVEMTWTLGPDIDAEDLEHWEATINTLLLPDFPTRIICQYNRSRLSPEVILASLHTHPLAIIGEQVHPNPFYQAPLILGSEHHQDAAGYGHRNGARNAHRTTADRKGALANGRSNGSARNNGRARSNGRPLDNGAAARVEWMIGQLERARAAEKAREELIQTQAALAEAERSRQALQEATNALAEANEQLEQRVAERTAELRASLAELESFSYSITHDMRAPLRSMQSFAKLLEQDCASRLSPEGKEHLRRIASSARRMDRLIQDVLSYSHIVRAVLAKEVIDLDQLLGDILESYPAFHEPAAKIEIQRPLHPILANEAGLTQCLSNLIGNALKFVAPGTVPHVRIWTHPIGDRIRIYVQDNGIGIAERYQAKIFGIFERLSKGYEGTGIGLAIVKKAAERMDGSVGLQSEPGKGSTFWVELSAPLDDPARNWAEAGSETATSEPATLGSSQPELLPV